MLLDPDDSQLILIDYQVKLMPALFEGVKALANAQVLGKIAKRLELPVWGTEQNPVGLGQLVPELRNLCTKTLPKLSFNACEDGLLDWLQPKQRQPQSGSAISVPKHLRKAAHLSQSSPEPSRKSVVLAGCEAHVCLLQTALGLLENDFDVWVVTDACTSRTERNRDAAFDRLAGAGAELVTTEMVAFEWLGSCEHPDFKTVLELLK